MPTEALDIDKDFGTLAKGKAADLLVLEKNPLENITNMRTIQIIYLGARNSSRDVQFSFDRRRSFSDVIVGVVAIREFSKRLFARAKGVPRLLLQTKAGTRSSLATDRFRRKIAGSSQYPAIC